MRLKLTTLAARGFLVGMSLALVVGCATPERVARHIVTAPNVQHKPASGLADRWIQTVTGGKDPFRHFAVPVGPPAATLQVMELPSGDYHVEITTAVKTNRNGRREFSLAWHPNTNSSPAPCAARGTIFLLPGYAVEKEIMLPWAFVLSKAGYRTVLVDLRGQGRSTGRTFSCGKYEATDLTQVLDYLAAKTDSDREVGVLGLSFGADLALLWGARDSRVRTIVAIAAYNHPEDALNRLAREMGAPLKPAVLRKAAELAAAWLDLNWAELSGEYALRHLAVPVLLIGGGKDTISPPADLEALKQAAPPRSRSLVVPEANHAVVGFWLHEIARPVTTWFEEHLPTGSKLAHAGSR